MISSNWPVTDPTPSLRARIAQRSGAVAGGTVLLVAILVWLVFLGPDQAGSGTPGPVPTTEPPAYSVQVLVCDSVDAETCVGPSFDRSASAPFTVMLVVTGAREGDEFVVSYRDQGTGRSIGRERYVAARRPRQVFSREYLAPGGPLRVRISVSRNGVRQLERRPVVTFS
jgi:hypothetical protein